MWRLGRVKFGVVAKAGQKGSWMLSNYFNRFWTNKIQKNKNE